MAHKRKGQLTVTGEWAKHLRKYLKRAFWKGERRAGRHTARNIEVDVKRSLSGVDPSARPSAGK